MKKKILFPLMLSAMFICSGLVSCQGSDNPPESTSVGSSDDNIVKHHVVFDLNGGHLPTGEISIPDQFVEDGHWVKEPKVNPIKEHSTFLGWFSDLKNPNSMYNFINPVYGDLVLYAKYSVNESEKIVLTIDPNNGESVYTVETFIGDYPNIQRPDKEGYSFVGWYYEDGTKFSGYVESGVGKDKIVAKFEKAKFNLQYHIEDDETVTIDGLQDINATSIDIPSSINGREVKRIGEKAFQSRIYLQYISLPATISEIDARCFNGARALQSIIVDKTNPYFCDENGVLYTKDKTVLLHCSPKNSSGTSFTVPSTVKKIGDYAFYYHYDSGINSINFNEGLEEIGDYAFYYNTLLSNLNFPSTLKRIGKSAFNCISAQGNIQVVMFNEGLEEIGESAFVGAYFKDSFALPSTIKKIGEYAFTNCTAIKEFTFPRDLEEFHANAFFGATGLITIKLESGNTNFKIEDNILYTADGTKCVFCPSGRTEKVKLIDTVTEIGEFAFAMVDQCQEYELPLSLQKIGDYAFKDCYGLKSFIIPDSVTEIGQGCFEFCEKLTSITIGTGLSIIPVYAFGDCYSLNNVVIPSNVTRIEENAFSGCSKLSTVQFNEGLKYIGAYAFKWFAQSSAEESEFPTYESASMSELVLPNSLEEIGDGAFANQGALKTVTLGKNLKTIGVDIFADTDIQSLFVNGANPYFSTENNILYSKDKTIAYYCLKNYQGALILPSTLKEIKDRAFENCKNITSVTFPASLRIIGSGAFHSAFSSSNKTTLEFNEGLTTIMDGAFYMSSLYGVKFKEGLTTIGDSAFALCDLEGELVLPESLQTIGHQAFTSNRQLTSLTLGDNITTIGDEAFASCVGLSGTIKLPAKLSKLGLRIFLNNEKIDGFDLKDNASFTYKDGIIFDKEIKTVVMAAPKGCLAITTLPDTVERIAPYGMCNALSVSSLVLPSSLKTIEEGAFTNMINVSSINIPSSVTFVGKAAFKNWGRGSASQRINFSCTEDFALTNFEYGYLSDINTSKCSVTYTL